MGVASKLVRVVDSYCTVARRVGRAMRALDDHWIGDLLGAVSLFAMLYVALVAGWALQ